MIPYMVGKLAPNSSHLTRGLVKYVPGRGYFRAVLSQNGDKFGTSPPPPQSLNGSSCNLSTQFRLEGFVSPLTCAGSGKEVTHGFEQISAATIANLQRISSRGQASSAAIAVKVCFALDNSCMWPKWRHFIDADMQPYPVLSL